MADRRRSRIALGSIRHTPSPSKGMLYPLLSLIVPAIIDAPMTERWRKGEFYCDRFLSLDARQTHTTDSNRIKPGLVVFNSSRLNLYFCLDEILSLLFENHENILSEIRAYTKLKLTYQLYYRNMK
jgi:hypothetical protein